MITDKTDSIDSNELMKLMLDINFSHLLLMLENTNDARHEQTCKDSALYTHIYAGI